MTPEEVSNMTEDAVDEYIAEKVLGLHWVGVEGREDWGRWEGGSGYPKEVGWPDSDEWSPSRVTDGAIEAAQKVGLEQTDSQGLTFWFSLLWEGGTEWSAMWDSPRSPYPLISASAKTCARAVCNATILANESKKKE
jgi:hypothetical protein